MNIKKNPFFAPEGIDIGTKPASRWVEDNYSVDVFHRQKGGEYLSLSLSDKKISLILLILLLGLMLLFGKIFYLQVVRGNHYFSLAENNRLRTKYIKAHRGVIYDRNGQLLVKNVFGFSLLITPADLPQNQEKRKKVLNQVADIFELKLSDIEKKIKSASHYYFQPVVVATGIDYEHAMRLKIDSADLPGISLELDPWRHYLTDDSFSHLMGYVGKINEKEYEAKKESYILSDNIGKTGLEKYYEDDLRGVYGKKQVEIDALGREKKIVVNQAPVSGCDLKLTIDQKLQAKVYEILGRHLGGNYAATVIISNPQNGEMLALVDYPSYNNNLFATGISQEDYDQLLNDKRKPLFTRSILGEYPPGSTIKPVMASAALEEGVVTPDKSFFSVGGIWVADKWFFPDWKAGGHGWTNVYKAIAQSVNTYFYYIGGGYKDFKGLGADRISYYLRLFGLDKKLGIDLPGEKSGLIPSPEWKEKTKNEKWYIGDTYHLSIGQGDILVTPLQVNSYDATIANGGTIYKPHLVKEILHPDGTVEMIMPEVINKNFIAQKNIAVVRQGMREAVTYGSAAYLRDLPVMVAGKTGTAQWHPTKKNHAWFMGFAPYKDPTFAITVLVEEGGAGDKVAVPIAKEILRYWFTR